MSRTLKKSTNGYVWGYCECKKKHINNWRSCITPYYKQVICLECLHSWYTKKPYVNALKCYDLLDELCLKEGTKLSERNLKTKDMAIENMHGFVKQVLKARKSDYKIYAGESDKPGNVKFRVEVNVNSNDYERLYQIFNFNVKKWFADIERMMQQTGNSIITIEELDPNREGKTQYLLAMGYEYKGMIVHGEGDNMAYDEFVKPFYIADDGIVFGQFAEDIDIRVSNELEIRPYDPNIEPKTPFTIRRFKKGEWVILTKELYNGVVHFRPLGEDKEIQIEPVAFCKFSLSPSAIPNRGYFADFDKTLHSVIVGEAYIADHRNLYYRNCFIIENEHGLRTLFNSFGNSVPGAFDSVEKAVIWKRE